MADESRIRPLLAERGLNAICPARLLLALTRFGGEFIATGATKNSSLVAVSTGLLESMTRDEVEAVLAREVAHIANGDVVTLTLCQGGANTFVIFLARVFGIIAAFIVMCCSRQRENCADRGSAQILGTPRPMIAALHRLGALVSLFSSPPIEARIAALQT